MLDGDSDAASLWIAYPITIRALLTTTSACDAKATAQPALLRRYRRGVSIEEAEKRSSRRSAKLATELQAYAVNWFTLKIDSLAIPLNACVLFSYESIPLLVGIGKIGE